MTTTWVVVGHRTGARILSHAGPGKPLVLVEERSSPKGRLKSGEIDTDRPGVSREGGMAHSAGFAKAETAHDHVAAQFAREVGQAIDRGRVGHRYESLVLVAEPGFLGMIGEGLPRESEKLVRARVTKDLAHVATADLGPHLAGVLVVGDPSTRLRTS